MIPKIIHYCWFGGSELTASTKKYIDGWKKLLPNYKIMEWNENNFHIKNCCNYVQQAYQQQKWAFVSDYVRLSVLYQYGGIYLDTDVEVLKSFDPLLKNKAFIGAESKYSICTAVIGAESRLAIIRELLDLYDKKNFIVDRTIDNTPNSKRIFEFFQNKYGYIHTNDIVHDIGTFTVYPEDFFSPINCYTLRKHVTANTYSIHWYSATWKEKKERRRDNILALLTRVIGEENREKIKKLRHKN